METVIKGLNDFDAPITKLDPVLNKLDVDIKDSLNDYLDLSQTTIATLVNLRVSITCCLNFRVLLQQQLLNLYIESDQPQDQAQVLQAMRNLSSYYVSLRTFGINRMTDNNHTKDLKDKCDKVAAKAIAKVTAVQSGGSVPLWPWTPNKGGVLQLYR